MIVGTRAVLIGSEMWNSIGLAPGNGCPGVSACNRGLGLSLGVFIVSVCVHLFTIAVRLEVVLSDVNQLDSTPYHYCSEK